MRIFIIILWLILGVIYWWIWDNGVEKCCGDNAIKTETAIVDKSVETTKTIVKSTLPLAFNWDGEKPVLGEGFEAYKESLLSGLKEGEIFEISGFYRESEKNSTKYDNLGIARANELRKLFPKIPDDRIRLFGKLIPEKDGERTNLFVSASFKNAITNANVKEIDDKALIYFPFNSTSKLDNTKVEAYLRDVAERLKKSGEKVYLSGHTDNIGSDASNIALGRRRANVVRNYLISKGVSSSLIIISSKGESEPISSNDTSEGRAKNRRVELKIK